MVREPADAFRKVSLELAEIAVGQTFGRIYWNHYPALGFGKTASRFSDPRRRKPENRFGILYLGESLSVCFVETLIRDERDGVFGDLLMSENELGARRYAEIAVTNPLKLVDLRGDAAIRMGVPSDVARSSRQALSRKWSVAFNEHPYQPDGIIYASRLNGQTNLAIYDRAASKLEVQNTMRLHDAPGLANVLDKFRVALVSDPA